MSYGPVGVQTPIRTVCPSNFTPPRQNLRRVDLGGIEPPSEQLILGHAKIVSKCGSDPQMLCEAI